MLVCGIDSVLEGVRKTGRGTAGSTVHIVAGLSHVPTGGGGGQSEANRDIELNTSPIWFSILYKMLRLCKLLKWSTAS